MMTQQATPDRLAFHGDASLRSMQAALLHGGTRPLRIEYAGRISQPGYRVTEVKAASFVTLDCGGNPDQWRETILQVEDAELAGEATPMTAAKLAAILDKVASRIEIDADARLTFEVGPPGAPMQVFDVDALELRAGEALLRLADRSAVCKPRHRTAVRAAPPQCCGPAGNGGSGCC